MTDGLALRFLSLAAAVPLFACAVVARAQDAGAGAPPPPDAPSGGEARTVHPQRPVIVRPHLAVGFLAGPHETFGLGLDAGLRVHPVLLVYSGAVLGVGEEYLTFSGVKVGYQHTLSPWFAAYGAVGFGTSHYGVADARELHGSAFAFEAGAMLGEERGLNYVSLGVELFVPVPPGGLPPGSRLDEPQVAFVVMVNPLLLAAAR